MADKPKMAENKSQASQLKELDGAESLTDVTTPVPPPIQGMGIPPMEGGNPSMFNPLWQLAARLNGVSPINGLPQPGGSMAQFQQGPMNPLPPVPQGAGMPLPQ